MVFVGILSIVNFLVHAILLPIDALISTYLPSLSTMFTSIASFLHTIFDGIGWAISFSGLSSFALTIIAAYWTFKLTVPIQVWAFKLFLHWYHTIKP